MEQPLGGPNFGGSSASARCRKGRIDSTGLSPHLKSGKMGWVRVRARLQPCRHNRFLRNKSRRARPQPSAGPQPVPSVLSFRTRRTCCYQPTDAQHRVPHFSRFFARSGIHKHRRKNVVREGHGFSRALRLKKKCGLQPLRDAFHEFPPQTPAQTMEERRFSAALSSAF